MHHKTITYIPATDLEFEARYVLEMIRTLRGKSGEFVDEDWAWKDPDLTVSVVMLSDDSCVVQCHEGEDRLEPYFVSYPDGRIDVFHQGPWVTRIENEVRRVTKEEKHGQEETG